MTTFFLKHEIYKVKFGAKERRGLMKTNVKQVKILTLLKCYFPYISTTLSSRKSTKFWKRKGNRGGGWGGEHPKKAIQTTDGDDESDLIFS